MARRNPHDHGLTMSQDHFRLPELVFKVKTIQTIGEVMDFLILAPSQTEVIVQPGNVWTIDQDIGLVEEIVNPRSRW